MYTDEYANMSEEMAESLLGLSGLDFHMNIVSSAISIAAYILLALGLYTIAKRRGIKNPWLAWVPVANVWTLGCISDQYQYVVNGRQKGKRKALLILNILMYVLMVVMVVCLFAIIFGLLGQLDSNLGMMDEDLIFEDTSFVADAVGPALGMVGTALVVVGISLAVSVLQFMAYYDLFASCEPSNKALYLVLGIVTSFFGLPLMSVFVFVCRNKDLGMPPRRDQIPQPNSWQPNYNVGWQPPQPNGWQPPQPNGWQPPQPNGWQPPQPNGWQPPQPNDWQPPQPNGWQPPQPNDWQPPQPPQQPQSPVDPEHWAENNDQ